MRRAMRPREAVVSPYAQQGHDAVRKAFEERLLGRLLRRLLEHAQGGSLLDMGCGDGLVARLAGTQLKRYLGVDLDTCASSVPSVAHDLRDGLGPVGRRPFDVYLGSFGIASHLPPHRLGRLLADIARHARPGAVVALEALGLHSLEWPRLWGVAPGAGRMIPYRLASDVAVHPWGARELSGMFDDAGIRPFLTLDRTLQAGPKGGEGRYWRGLPDVRGALNRLLAGEEPGDALKAPLAPLPAGDAALVHHALAMRRRELLARTRLRGPALAEAVWRLEPCTTGGYGHGLLVAGKVR